MLTRLLTLAIIGCAFAIASAMSAWAKDAPKNTIKDPTDRPATQPSDSPLNYTVKTIDGKDFNLADLRGKVVMIVNVASKCGNTPQYDGLEKMYNKYKDQGFVILGFPANDFNHQEPGTDEQIQKFCTDKYSVTFPMMSKISVKDPEKAPLYKFLTDKATNGDFAGPIDWNFAKFLVDRNGNVIARFAAGTKPETPALVEEVEKALAAKAADSK